MDINNYISSGIIEMYVMGLCSSEEKIEMENLRGQYPQLNDAILDYENHFEKNLMNNAILPGIETDHTILQSLKFLPAPDAFVTRDISKSHRTIWLKIVAVAACLLLFTSILLNYILYNKVASQQLVIKEKENYSPLPVADYNILKQRTITPVAMYGVSPHNICRCTIFWDKQTGKVYIMIHHLLPSTAQTNYQLWAMVDGKPVNVGILNDKIRDRFIEIPNVPAAATGFIVTLEKAGGNNTPTVEETYLSGKI